MKHATNGGVDSVTGTTYRRRTGQGGGSGTADSRAAPRPRVRELRLARGWSQVVLARVADVSVRSIARYEAGSGAAARNVAALVRVAAALGAPVAEVFPEVFGRRAARRKA